MIVQVNKYITVDICLYCRLSWYFFITNLFTFRYFITISIKNCSNCLRSQAATINITANCSFI